MALEKHTMEGMRKHGEETHTHDHTKWYIATIIALFFLTGVTVLAAGVHFGSNTTNLVIAMVIATMKASLVVLFFMHLRWEKGMNAIVFLSSLFFVGAFMTFTFIDVNTRVTIEPQTPVDASTPAGFEPSPMPVYVVPPAKGAEGGHGEAHETGTPAAEKPAAETPAGAAH